MGTPSDFWTILSNITKTYDRPSAAETLTRTSQILISRTKYAMAAFGLMSSKDLYFCDLCYDAASVSAYTVPNSVMAN